MSHSLALGDGPYHFFDNSSFKAALSSIDSANSFFSLRFSSSSVLSRLGARPGRRRGGLQGRARLEIWHPATVADPAMPLLAPNEAIACARNYGRTFCGCHPCR
jgi:hypothetical protein